MPSTFSPNKNYELQATGEHQGTWGVVLNSEALSIIDLNLGGRQAITINSSNVTLTAEEQENVFITLTGTLTGNRDLIFTATAGGFFFIKNDTTGSFQVTAKPSGGAGVVVPQGFVTPIFISPTAAAAFSLATPSILTTAGDIIYQGALAPARLAAGSQGAVLTQGGSAVPAWLAPPSQGAVFYFGGSTAPAWLAVGTSGQFLQTQGAAANPQWAWPSPAERSSFSARKSVTQTGINISALITFDTETFDVGSFYGSNRWTPPSGTVILTATLSFSDISAGDGYVHIYKNGSVYRVSDIGVHTLTIIDQCNGTDYYEVYSQASDASYSIRTTNAGSSVGTFFMGSMI